MNNNCLARTNCKSFNTEICSTNCPLFLDIRYQIELSGIPKKHQHFLASTLPDTYYGKEILNKYSQNIVERVNKGQGWYLFSDLTGTGKSTTVCALSLEYIIEQLKADYREGSRTLQLVKYVNVPDFLDLIRQGFDNEEIGAYAQEQMEIAKKCKILILDDLGSEKATEWVKERLFTIIASRYDDELATFCTSNCDLQQLQLTLGTRIRSRIEGMTIPLEVKSSDHRRKI